MSDKMPNYVMLRSVNGTGFLSVVEKEPDGSLTILSTARGGYRSAHRRYAREAFGTPVRKVVDTAWINRGGVRVRATRWERAS